MEHRRLSLHRQASAGFVSFQGTAVHVPHVCLGVSDTDTGRLAVEFALTLLTGLAELGLRIPAVFSAFGAPPDLERAQRARLEACASAVWSRGLAPEEGAARALLEELTCAHEAAPAWLHVGEPALLAFVAPIRVLVVGERPLTGWSPALRALRPQLSLELSGARTSLARPLSHLLATTLAP